MLPTPTASRAGGRALRVGLAVAIGLLLGFAVASLVYREDAPSNFSGAPSVQRLDLPAAGAIAAPAPTRAPAEITEPPSAQAALEQFLAAEADRRGDVSFALLDPETAKRIGTVAAWESQRANRLLPASFRVTSVAPRPEGMDITIAAEREPAVTPLTGLEPARSDEVWRVVGAAGSWRVQAGQPVDVRPVLPSDDAATSTATQWLERTSTCDDAGAAALQLPGAVLGAPALAERPCAAPGAFSIGGGAVPLAEISNSTVFVSAFGPGVGRWARAVAVTGDPRFTIVLAPLGDEWRVMGLVADSSPRP